MALLGLDYSQGFSERPLKKSGNGFQEAGFSAGLGPSWWVEEASYHLHFWVLAQSGSLALHNRVQGPTMLLSTKPAHGKPGCPW